jgi:high-affinity iron transporter
MIQPLKAQAPDQANYLWAGLGVAAILLVGVYLAIRYLSIKIPMRPFFLATSALLALLAFTFAGSGVKELQEAGAMPITPIPGIGSVDLLGIYPTVQTLAAQGIVLAILAVGFVAASRKLRAARAQRADAPQQTRQLENTK